jgi:hypothetical protein
MSPRVIKLRFSIRGADGEHEHALIARMRKRRQWTATTARWKLVGLELRWRGRRRDLSLRRVNATDRDALSVMAERQAGARAHD